MTLDLELLTELYGGFSADIVDGSYLIPWGRVELVAEHVEKGLEEGSGERLWAMLEEEVKDYV
jgi:hypothetical protein